MFREISHCRKVLLFSAAIILVLIGGLRLAAPYVVKHVINRQLQTVAGYAASIQDVDLGVLALRASFDGLILQQKEESGDRPRDRGAQTGPLLRVERVTTTFVWSDLLRGRLTAAVSVNRPQIRYDDPPPTKEKDTPSKSIRERIDDLIPLRIRELTIQNGTLSVTLSQPRPAMTFRFRNLDANIRNIFTGGRPGPMSTLALSANTTGSGILSVDGRFDLTTPKSPTVDINAQLRSLNLPSLNPIFERYAQFDFERGVLDLFTEVKVTSGQVTGYVKPIFEDVDILKIGEEEGDNVFELFWEALVGAGAEVLENQPKDRLAARIRLEGALSNPNADVFQIIESVLTNAFVRALVPRIDHSVGL